MKKEDHDLRERTKEFALRIIRLFTTLPGTPEAQILGKQVLRSGTSVGANYREAYRGRSKAEFVAKCGDSLREIEKNRLLARIAGGFGDCRPGEFGFPARRMRRTDRHPVTIIKRSKENQS